MGWLRFMFVVLGAGIVVSLTDWLAAGDWLHRRWTYPEIWRQGNEEKAIALTSPLPFVTAAIFTYVATRFKLRSVESLLRLAVAIWAMVPLPLILTNAAFMKWHRVFVASYAIGWLVKLTVLALAVGWFAY